MPVQTRSRPFLHHCFPAKCLHRLARRPVRARCSRKNPAPRRKLHPARLLPALALSLSKVSSRNAGRWPSTSLSKVSSRNADRWLSMSLSMSEAGELVGPMTAKSIIQRGPRRAKVIRQVAQAIRQASNSEPTRSRGEPREAESAQGSLVKYLIQHHFIDSLGC